MKNNRYDPLKVIFKYWETWPSSKVKKKGKAQIISQMIEGI